MSTIIPPLDMNYIDWPSNTSNIPPLTIKGTPIIATKEWSETDLQDYPLSELDIKMELCKLLAEEMFKSDVIEFTRETRVDTLSTVCRARIFVTPKDITQMLRTAGVVS